MGQYYSVMLGTWFPDEKIGKGTEQKSILNQQIIHNKLLQEQNKLLQTNNIDNNYTHTQKTFIDDNEKEIYYNTHSIYDTLFDIMIWVFLISVGSIIFVSINPGLFIPLYFILCISSIILLFYFKGKAEFKRDKLCSEYRSKLYKQNNTEQDTDIEPKRTKEQEERLMREYMEFVNARKQ